MPTSDPKTKDATTGVVPQLGALVPGAPPDAGRRRWLALALAPVALGGCSVAPDADHAGADAPSALAPTGQVRTAWVFSSGGPRGFVHVGVLKALAELGLKPDLIVGASVGALVGALCAAGRGAAEIEALALDVQPWKLARVSIGTTEHFNGAALADFVREECRGRLIEQLRLPLICAAHRLDGGGVVGFNRGDLGLAIQAASAIEGRFTPVRIRGLRYVDADLHMPLPVRLARAAGATRVLAVDASAFEDRAPAGAGRYRESDLHKRALTRPDSALADVVLHPEFGYWVSLSRDFRERAIDAGYRATLAAAVRLRALHAG